MIPPTAWAPLAQAGAQAVTGLANAAAGGPMTTAAQTDARSFMDGSGWTVATGKSTARGGRWGNNDLEGQRPATATNAAPAPGYHMGYVPGGDGAGFDMQANFGGLPLVGLLIVGAALILARR